MHAFANETRKHRRRGGAVKALVVKANANSQVLVLCDPLTVESGAAKLVRMDVPRAESSRCGEVFKQAFLRSARNKARMGVPRITLAAVRNSTARSLMCHHGEIIATASSHFIASRGDRAGPQRQQ